MQCSSNKQVYATRAIANAAARRIKVGGSMRRKKEGFMRGSSHLRPYLCPECGCWHLWNVGKRMEKRREEAERRLKR